MIIWCNKPELFITSDKEPKTAVRKPLPSDTIQEREDKKAKPYLNKIEVTFTVNYLGTVYVIDIPRGYTWNGANIPRCFWWLIGSMGESEFLNASMLHDRLTERKCIIAYDRQLSSMIFRELLIASGVSKFKANIMYKSVDIYQKLFCSWDI
jgi:hypothetical protein